MRIEWLYEAKLEYRDLLLSHKNTVGTQSAEKFAKMILSSVRKLETFPQLGVLKETQLLGQYGFRALFIGKYVCIYRIVEESVLIYHIADARTNYMYHILAKVQRQEDDVAQDVEQDRAQDYGFKMEL